MSTEKTFLLPDLGEGLTEAELLSWSVAVGDTVELNQVIAEVETAKAMVELPSPYAGTVVALHAEAGTTIEVGSPFITVAVTDDSSADAAEPVPSERASGGAPGPTGEKTPVLVGYGIGTETGSRRRRKSGTSRHAPPSAAPRGPASAAPLASPPVRYAARQHGVALSEVPATGASGNVTRDDLERFVQSGAPAADIAPPIGSAVVSALRPDEDRTPIKGVRKHTAQAMVRSAFTAPHVTEFVDIDVTATLDLLEKLRATQHFTSVRLTPLALVAKALLVALRTNASLNSYWDEPAQQIVTKHYVNLGIAAATPRGLMVPNIKNAHTLGLRDLAEALSTLTLTAKEGKTQPGDLTDGTITITNIGVFGIDSGTPILNPGEAAILCFGAIRRRPWEFEGDIALRSVTTLSLSFDHRLVDGEQGSRFLAAIADILHDPTSLIALS